MEGRREGEWTDQATTHLSIETILYLNLALVNYLTVRSSAASAHTAQYSSEQNEVEIRHKAV